MRKLAEPIYQSGAQGLAALADDAKMRQEIVEGGGLLDLFTRDTHESLRRALLILCFVSLLLFIPLILFSASWIPNRSARGRKHRWWPRC